MSFSDYTEDAILNHLFRNVPLASPTTVYAALFTSDPGEASGGTEVAAGANSYARQAISFGAPGGGAVANTVALTWTNMPAAFVSHVAVMDALTGGNMLAYAALSYTVNVAAGEPFVIDIGNLTVTQT